MLLELDWQAGVSIHELPVRIGAAPLEVERLVRDAVGSSVQVGDRLFPAGHLEEIRARLLSLVDEFHSAEPLEPGAPLHLLRSRLGAAAALADLVIGPLVADGLLRTGGAVVARAGWAAQPSPEQQRRLVRLEEALRTAGREPPSVGELAGAFGEEVGSLLRYLERQGVLIRVETERYYDRSRLGEMMDSLRRAMQGREPVGPAALREALGVSRKFLIPFLEYCDRVGVTERLGEGRVLRNLPVAQLDT